ncbi:MAG: hypothetical protein ACLTK0_06060 [Anaerovoracaceae bacterium]
MLTKTFDISGLHRSLSIGEYPEAVAVMLFYQIEVFEDHAVVSRKSITQLMDINRCSQFEDG